ncbi:hypothetical protein RCO28_04625 [Streptomyces sp. LHD-70]|uniref:hypothetical protein n=1 Tax=Streptomyces sp. LHD-70 TaxID=3072140 RepID=UPI00280F1D4D|nr:hypothetical protein [Streptomyces sp. LHD-70]MDQ8701777.1 hypothetical protein [Streptomyces sp. LHD-70]
MTTAAPETGTREAERPPGTRAPHPARPHRTTTRLALPLLLALLALPLAAALHQGRPAPYGDRLTVHAPSATTDAERRKQALQKEGREPAPHKKSREPALQKEGRAVVAYDTDSGRPRWTYTREGRRPLAVLPAPGHAFTLWDDGLVTDTERRTGSAVRWHRAIPAGADWLRTPGARGGAGVLRLLDREAAMLAVVTPRRITAYRTVDGDLRWVLPARTGCAFRPARAVRHGSALLLAQPCSDPDIPWSEQVLAVDDLGRLVPGRTPLGNALPGGATAAAGAGKALGKVVAHPR